MRNKKAPQTVSARHDAREHLSIEAYHKLNRASAVSQFVGGDLIHRELSGETAQVLLRGELIDAGARAQRREQTITRLLNENEQLRRWYSADLPDAVRRLHQRAACADAGDCLQRMPEGQSLPDAGK